MLNVLIVDDNPDMVVLMTQMVLKLGAKAYKASTGHQCEVMTADLRPDLILLDFDMPVQNGCDTCRHLRHNGYTGHIIIVSALSKVIGTIEALGCGADGFLSKPFSSDALQRWMEVVQEAMAGEML